MIALKGHDHKFADGVVKNCPFCGSNNIWSTGRRVYDSIVAEHGSACIEVGCADCHAGITTYSGGNAIPYDDLLTAATVRWNNRANEQF